LLEAALVLAVQLLVARHPDLLLPEDMPRIRPPPGLNSARAIVALVNVLLAEIARYDDLERHADPAGLENGRATICTAAVDDIPF
jgi:hypothetical protein